MTLLIFFQLRACDEVKDAEDDRRYRPERAVPRGLVSLAPRRRAGRGRRAAGDGSSPPCSRPLLLWPLLLVWLWLALMSAEFFVPAWLKARPFLYLISHMAIMPLIDLFVTACEWLPRAGFPPAGLWLFLVLSFVNGCVLEIGRKLYAPENERRGRRDLFRAAGTARGGTGLGRLRCASPFCCCSASAVRSARLRPVAWIGAVALVATLACAARYAQKPTPGAQKRWTRWPGSGFWSAMAPRALRRCWRER